MSCCKTLTSRRHFLLATGSSAATVALAACSATPEQELFSGGTLTQAIEANALPPGESQQLVVGSHQILLFRENEKTVHAFSAVCTHQGCIVGVSEDPSENFICPCHASNFDKTTGEAVAGPAQLPLTRHLTEITDGWIFVEVDPA